MGVDLTLRPLIYKDEERLYDELSVTRRRELWPLITELPSALVPQKSDNGWSIAMGTDDCYGNPLRAVSAGSLCSLRDNPDVSEDFRNRAIWAYLAQMPEDWPVVLYWS